MKKLLILSTLGIMIYACSGGNKDDKKPNASGETATTDNANKPGGGDPNYDAKRGVGKFTHVEVSPNLDAALADKGQKVFDVKCSGCHKLSDEKLVGPGWSGVTQRRSAEWIMNFVTNTEEMLSKDPEAQAQLEICLVRMPNQNLSDADARAIYEFQRRNDGVK